MYLPIRGTGPSGKEMLKNGGKRGGEMQYTSISPPRPVFLCGKNGISLLKEISFLPQRRNFLAAKRFSGAWEAGKKGASGGFPLPDGARRRTKCK